MFSLPNIPTKSKGAHSNKKSFFGRKKDKSNAEGRDIAANNVDSSGVGAIQPKPSIMDRVEGLSLREKTMIFVLLIILFGAIFIVAVFIPIMGQMDNDARELIVAQSAEQDERLKISQFQPDKKSYEDAIVGYNESKMRLKRITGIAGVPEEGQMLPEQLDRTITGLVADKKLTPISLKFEPIQNDTPVVYQSPVIWGQGTTSDANASNASKPVTSDTKNSTNNASVSSGSSASNNTGSANNTSTDASSNNDVSANKTSGNPQSTANAMGTQSTLGQPSAIATSALINPAIPLVGGEALAYAATPDGATAEADKATEQNVLKSYSASVVVGGSLKNFYTFLDAFSDRFYYELITLNIESADDAAATSGSGAIAYIKNGSSSLKISMDIKIYVVDVDNTIEEEIKAASSEQIASENGN